MMAYSGNVDNASEMVNLEKYYIDLKYFTYAISLLTI